MQHTALETLALLVALLCAAVIIWAVRRRRNHAAVMVAAVVEPEKPFLRLLDKPAELEAAVRRAAEFERRMAVLLEARARRYESFLAHPATVVQIPTDRRAPTGGFSSDHPEPGSDRASVPRLLPDLP